MGENEVSIMSSGDKVGEVKFVEKCHLMRVIKITKNVPIEERCQESVIIIKPNT